MRNLRIIHRSDVNCWDGDSLTLSATTWETTESILCAFGPKPENPTIEIYRCKREENQFRPRQLITSWDVPSPSPDVDCDQIVNFQYFPDTNSCCLILSGGDIISIREEPLPGEEHIEILGTVDGGISAATWSPDEGYLAICTKLSSFILMSREFEPMVDVKFSPEDIQASKHVSVGWGKAETQFKGKRAKALRDPTVPEKIDQGLPSPLDDGKITISWRGDGEYVAINAPQEKGHRMIRVFSKEGVLDSVSEPVDFLEGALSWRPAGNLMAGIKRHEDKVEVVFFERNGLRHGQFPLRLSQTELQEWGTVIRLDWNSDSTALAVTFTDRVQIWTMGNYHYYLKQSIRILLEGDHELGHVRVCWSPEIPLLLSIYHPICMVVTELVFSVSKGSTIAPHDNGTLAVVDGSILNITPFRYANIPPPMSLFEINLDSEAIDVSVNSKLKLISVLREAAVDIFSYSVKKGGIFHYKKTKTIPIDAGHPRQIICTNGGMIFALYSPGYKGLSETWVSIADINESAPSLSYEHISKHTTSTIGLSLDGSEYFTNQYSGKLLREGASEPQDHAILSKLPVFCPWAELVMQEDFMLAIGLTRSGSLYVNDRLLIRNCTSFLVTAAHLIFTTSTHLLKFVHLTTADELEIPLDEPEMDERCRSIERGAKLVTVMPSSYSVILQMPRGNLETIYPRALVLAGIRQSIDKQDYKGAFLACRSQRVDMNIIHDHNPEVFMKSVRSFIDHVQKVEHIDLFLSQLRDEDVSQTMYRDTTKKSTSAPVIAPTGFAVESTSKINIICDAFLQELESRAATNLQNTITAHVSKSPPDLDGGLLIISNLKNTAQDKAEGAAEHICFLADSNQLYDHALGIYDLDVALLIAQQSQKDPREYLPYIQSLQEQSTLRRKFTIDNDLKRYGKALIHLHEMDAFDEVQSFIQKQEMYSAAIELYKYRQDRLEVLMRLYADHLIVQRSFKKAGIAYEYLSDHVSALQSYRQANLWREALYSAQVLQWPTEKIQNLGTELIEALEESKGYQAIAQIQIDYLNDIEAGTKFLCKAYQFAEATRISISHNRTDLLETSVDGGLVECFNTTTELLADCKTQLTSQMPRLRELRIKKEQEPLAFYAGDPSAGADVDIPDDISLAPTEASTSGGTFMTRYTNRSTGTLNSQATRRTSRGRRREERKRARGKKGSVYEEEYLINSIGRLIERLNDVNDDVARLVEGLMKRRMREQAGAVENAMLEVIGMCQAVLGEVFGVQEAASNPAETNGEEAVPTGGNAVLQDSMEAVRGPKIVPTIKSFERLSLVG